MHARRRIRPFIVGGLLAAAVAARAQVGGHHIHPPMPDQQYFLSGRIEGEGEVPPVEVALKLGSAATAEKLDQTVALPAPLGPVRVKQYLPRAERVQRVVPDARAGAKPAVELFVEGPTQSYRLWLVADDPERNRLTSLIGSWRYMSVSDGAQRDALLQQWKTELTRDPLVIISRLDGSAARQVAAKAGAKHELPELECTLRVKAFYPHFSFDRETSKPVNQSDKRLNPAALVEIAQGDKREERWVFAKFPEYKAQNASSLPYRVTLDCPLDRKRPTPDFVLVTTHRETHEVWLRHEGETSTRAIAVAQPVDVVGSQYKFQIAEFVPAGRLLEEYRPSEQKGAGPALLVEIPNGADDPTKLWLELGQERAVAIAKGRAVLWFGPHQAAAKEEHKATP